LDAEAALSWLFGPQPVWGVVADLREDGTPVRDGAGVPQTKSIRVGSHFPYGEELSQNLYRLVKSERVVP
jgi:hypothetical protein